MNRMKKSVKNREELEIPVYSLKKQKRFSMSAKKIIPIAILLLLAVVIYVPPLIFDAPVQTYHASTALAANPAAMEEAITYLRNNPTADFDEDNLTNEEELRYGSGIYMIDNDGDGVTDFAELYITETNPCVYDEAILQYVKQKDAESGNSVNTPFKVHDIVMWADDYSSKARGSVIESYANCYTFSNFKGWVQFPTDVFAYEMKEGYQVPLQKSEQGYYRIEPNADVKNGIVTVYTYTEKPATYHVLSLLNTSYQLDDNFLGKALDFILPSKGFGLITCREANAADLDGSLTETAYTNQMVRYAVPELNAERFKKDTNQLSDLTTIIKQLDAGHNVILSLMSHTAGEVIIEAYGYTNHNNLLVCDPATGKDLGVLNIEVVSRRLLDQTKTIKQYEYFKFFGCGYSSNNRHRLAIIDYIPSDNSTYVPAQQQQQEQPPVKPEVPVADHAGPVINLLASYTEVSHYQNDGKHQKTVVDVPKDDIAGLVEQITVECHFDKYYDDSLSTQAETVYVMANADGDVVILRYTEAAQRLVLRIEPSGAEHTVELQEDKYVEVELLEETETGSDPIVNPKP